MIIHGIHIAYIPAIIAGCFFFPDLPGGFFHPAIGVATSARFQDFDLSFFMFLVATATFVQLLVTWRSCNKSSGYIIIYICTQVCIHYIYNVCLDIGFWMISRDIDDVYSGHICSSLGKKNPPSLCPEVQTPSDKLWKLSPTQAPRDLATGLLPYGSGSKFESLDWRIREKLQERTIFDGKNHQDSCRFPRKKPIQWFRG